MTFRGLPTRTTSPAAGGFDPRREFRRLLTRRGVAGGLSVVGFVLLFAACGSEEGGDPQSDITPTDATCEEAIERLCAEACACSDRCRFGSTNSTQIQGDGESGCVRQLQLGLCNAPNQVIDWGLCDGALMAPQCGLDFNDNDFLVLPSSCQAPG